MLDLPEGIQGHSLSCFIKCLAGWYGAILLYYVNALTETNASAVYITGPFNDHIYKPTLFGHLLRKTFYV